MVLLEVEKGKLVLPHETSKDDTQNVSKESPDAKHTS
jgi:hypothetical protein